MQSDFLMYPVMKVSKQSLDVGITTTRSGTVYVYGPDHSQKNVQCNWCSPLTKLQLIGWELLLGLTVSNHHSHSADASVALLLVVVLLMCNPETSFFMIVNHPVQMKIKFFKPKTSIRSDDELERVLCKLAMTISLFRVRLHISLESVQEDPRMAFILLVHLLYR
jgi:hypothetical protein